MKQELKHVESIFCTNCGKESKLFIWIDKKTKEELDFADEHNQQNWIAINAGQYDIFDIDIFKYLKEEILWFCSQKCIKKFVVENFVPILKKFQKETKKMESK